MMPSTRPPSLEGHARPESRESPMSSYRLCWLLAIMVIVDARFPAPQTPDQHATPTLAAAAATLQAGEASGAAKMLEAITQREPENGRAWRNLGLAFQQLKNLDGSIAAYERALKAEADVPTPMYNLAIVFAMKGDRDRAFEWLSRARATRKIDMTQIEVAPELASLKNDPRFAALLPKPEDFQNPFVEPVKILREWDGEAAGDQFGWIAR